MSNKIVSVAILLFALSTATVSAQDPVDVRVTITSPVPPYLDRWEEQIAVELQVNPLAPDDSYEVVILGHVQHLEPGSAISIRSNAPSRNITVSASEGPRLITLGELRDIFGVERLDLQGFNPLDYQSDGTRQRVPGGCYEICIQVYSADQLHPLGESCSAPFGVISVPPPRLLFPAPDEVLNPITDVALSPPFHWQQDPVVLTSCFAGPVPLLDYTISMVEVPEGVSPEDALLSGGLTTFRQQLDPGQTIYEFVPAEYPGFPLEQGQWYAWQIQAEDPSDEVYLENDGLSPIGTFRYGYPPLELLVQSLTPAMEFSPERTTQMMTTRTRILGPAPTGALATIDEATFTFLDGLRIVHGPVTVTEDIAGIPVGQHSPVLETDLEVDLPVSVQEAILGTRDEVVLDLSVRMTGTDEATLDEVSGSTEMEVTLRRSDLIIRFADSGEFLRFTPATNRQPIEYEFENRSSSDITIDSVALTWEFAYGVGSGDRASQPIGDVFSTGSNLIVPAGASVPLNTSMILDDDAQIERIRESSGGNYTEAWVTFRFSGLDNSGQRRSAAAVPRTYVQIDRPTEIVIDVHSPSGLPLIYSPATTDHPLHMTFHNQGATDVTFTRVVQHWDFQGSGVRTFDQSFSETFPSMSQLDVSAGDSSILNINQSISSTVQQELLAEYASSDSLFFTLEYVFIGTDSNGDEVRAALHRIEDAHNRIPAWIRSGGVASASITTPGGFPVQFNPGSISQPLNFVFHNPTPNDITLTRLVQEWLLPNGSVRDFEVDLATEFHRGDISIEAGTTVPLTVSMQVSDSSQQQIIDDYAAGELSATVGVTYVFTGVDDEESAVTVVAQPIVEALIDRATHVSATVSSPVGFPLVYNEGIEEQPLEIEFTNHSTDDVTLTSILQNWQMTGGGSREFTADFSSIFAGTDSISLAPNESRILSTQLRLSAETQTTIADDYFDGAASGAATITLIFDGTDSGGNDIRTTATPNFEIEINGDRDVVATVTAPDGFPLAYTDSTTSQRLEFQLLNNSSSRVSIDRIVQNWVLPDGFRTLNQPLVDVSPETPELQIDPGDSSTVQTSMQLDGEGQEQLLRDYADGADFADLEITYTFAGTDAAGDSINVVVTPTVDVEIGEDSWGSGELAFRAGSPTDGATVRGETTFTVEASQEVNPDHVTSVYFQIFEVPTGVTDTLAIKTSDNRVAERVFPGSGTSSQIRLDESNQIFSLLNSRGSDAEDDDVYSFLGDPDKTYLWTARIDFNHLPDGTAGALSVEMADAFFTTTDALAICGADCTLTAPGGASATEREADFYENKIVTIGAFDLKIATATGNGGGLTGEGEIEVPYLNAPLAVEFTNLRINEMMQVTGGEATGKTDRPDLLTSDFTDNVTEVSESLSITETDAARIQEISDFVESTGRIASALVGSTTPVQLPLGVDQNLDGEFLLLAIVGASFKPTGARVNAVMSVPLPDMDTRLSIGARGICLTPGGFDEEITFYLASDLFFNTEAASADLEYTVRFKSGTTDDEGTYLKWQCGAMEVLRIEMWHEFPRDWITPVDTTDGSPLGTGRSIAKLVVDIRPPGSGSSSTSSSDSTSSATGLQWIAAVTEFTPSGITDAPGFWFSVENMVYDNSSLQNISGMAWPDGYGGTRTNAWTGFHIERIRLRLPDEIKSYGEETSLEIGVESVLIDQTGLSFTGYVENLLHLAEDASSDEETGNMAGWEFSIDRLEVGVIHSSFGTASLEGEFKLPISEDGLIYEATLARPAALRTGSDGSETVDSGGDAAERFDLECADVLGGTSEGSSGPPDLIFEFLIHPADTIDADLWIADLRLDSSTKICVGNQSGGLQAAAELNGSLGINNDDERNSSPTELPRLPFEELRFMTFEPYAALGTWGRTGGDEDGDRPGSGIGGDDDDDTPADRPDDSGSSDDSGGGFSVGISDIGLATRMEADAVLVGLEFSLRVTLPGDGQFGAEATDLGVWGRVDFPADDAPVSADFHEFTVGGFCIFGEAAVVTINEPSCIEVYKNEVSGEYRDSGFRGVLDVTFIEKINVRVAGDFGKRKGPSTEFDYFFIDAGVTFEPGINIGGAVALYGFLGGFWYNMNREPLPPLTEVMSQPEGADSEEIARARQAEVLGQYSPVAASGEGSWGFRAGVVLGTAGNPETLNADVTFFAEFNGGGGLNRVGFEGDAYILTGLTDRADPKVQARLTIVITANPPDGREGPIFDATFSLAANLEIVTISNASAVIHVAPDEWWFRIADPAPGERARAEILGLGIEAYIAMGDNLPQMPDPPEGAPQLPISDAVRNATSGSSVSGFMMGAKLDLGFEFSALVYLKVGLGIGFDIAVQQALVQCLNLPPGDNYRGNDDGWYFEGQMYAYASIDFGIDIWVGRISLAKASAGATIRGGFSHPDYLVGRAEISIELLGGAVTFDDGVDFKEGEACVGVGENPLLDLELVTELRPESGSPSNDGIVSPFVEPTALLFIDIEKEFSLEDELGNVRSFRLTSEGIDLENLDDSEASVNCRRVLQDSGAALICKPIQASGQSAWLEPNSRYRASITVVGQERIAPGPDGWGPAETLEGGRITASKTVEFATGELPDTFDGYVAYSYPFNGQRYLLPEESSTGVVMTTQSFEYLASRMDSDPANASVSLHLRLTELPEGGEPIEVPIRVEATGSYFKFDLPDLQPETVYGAQVVRRVSVPQSLADRVQDDFDNIISSGEVNIRTSNVELTSTIFSDMYDEYEASRIRIRQRTLGALVVANPNEKVLHHFVFRTSKHDDLASKLAESSTTNATLAQVDAFFFQVNDLETNLIMDEAFDVFDLQGTGYETSYGYGLGRQDREVVIPSLIATHGSDQTNYFRGYANLYIYEPIQIIRRYTGSRYIDETYRSTFQIEGTMVDVSTQLAQQGLPTDPHDLAAYLTPPPPPARRTISTGGLFAPTGSMGLSTTSLGGSDTGTLVTSMILDPFYPLKLRDGTAAWLDLFHEYRVNLPSFLYYTRGLSTTDRARLEAAYTTRYVEPSQGIYVVDFAFRVPSALYVLDPPPLRYISRFVTYR